MRFLQKLHFHLLLMHVFGFHSVRSDVITNTVHIGNTTTLTCPHERGTDFLMSTWKIHHLDKLLCTVSFTIDGNKTYNGCNNRTHQNIGAEKVTLTLENSTASDERNYTCEVVNGKGTLISTIKLRVLATPLVLIRPVGSRAAECLAVGGHPAATITWNSSGIHEVTNKTLFENNNTTTVISAYTPTEDNETEVTCAVHHPTFPSPVVLNIKIPAAETKSIWWVSIPIAAIVVIVVIALFLWQISSIRTFFTNKRGNTSESQENPTVIVEDLEPYASFTQKVNSIYNSTTELSDAKVKDLATDYGIEKMKF